MTRTEDVLIRRFSNSQEVLRLATGAVRAALLDHMRTGDSIAIWRHGRVVIVPANQIELPQIESKSE